MWPWRLPGILKNMSEYLNGSEMISEQQRRHAIARIRAKQQLGVHALVFALMGAYFIFLWARSGSAVFWPAWAMFGWGIGLAGHAFHVLGWQRGISEDRIRREVSRFS